MLHGLGLFGIHGLLYPFVGSLSVSHSCFRIVAVNGGFLTVHQVHVRHCIIIIWPQLQSLVQVGYAILRAEGYETTDEIVFAEAGDMTQLGVRTLEGFGVAVDNIGHRFVAQTTIVANVGHIPPGMLTSQSPPEEVRRRGQEADAPSRRGAG